MEEEKMGKYQDLAQEIIKQVGGKKNILSVTHCVTRLRFKLKDESKANDDVIKNMDGVVTVMKSGGQYQVVIGNHVPEVFADVQANIGTKVTDSEDDSTESGSLFDRFISLISGIFQPVLGMMSAAGMLKGLNILFSAIGLYSNASGVYIFLDGISDAFFMFMPVFLGYTAAQKFNLKPLLGILLGLGLCYPSLQLSSLSGTGEPLYTLFNGTVFSAPVYLDLFGIPMISMDYTSTVLPIIFIVYLGSKCQKLFDKIIPDVVKFFISPMLTLVVSLTVGYLLVGPIATYGATMIAEGIISIRSFSPLISGAVVGFFWQILVIFGLHWGIIPIYINNIMTVGYDNVMMPFFATTFAQTAVVFAIMLKTKDKKLKQIALPSVISGIFGITEPAIYGITLPRKKTFIISCIASGIAGAYYGFADLREYIMGGMGIFEFPSLINPETQAMDNMIVGVIGVILAMAIGFVLTMVLFKDESTVEGTSTTNTSATALQTATAYSPLKGNLIQQEEIQDAAFSQGLLGKGVGIYPTEGEVVAPFDGTVMSLFPTKHAIGVVSDDGLEMLIHVGLDTVQLDGKYFEAYVSQGDRIEKGQKLLSFDIPAIKAAGYSVEVPIVITNSNDYKEIIITNKSDVEEKEFLLSSLI